MKFVVRQKLKGCKLKQLSSKNILKLISCETASLSDLLEHYPVYVGKDLVTIFDRKARNGTKFFASS